MSEMRCTNCGLTRSEGVSFCPNCGTKLVPVEREEIKFEQPVQMENVQRMSAEPEMMAQPVAPNAPWMGNNPGAVAPGAAPNVRPNTYKAKKAGPSTGKKVFAVLVCLLGGFFVALLLISLSFRSMISQNGIEALFSKAERQSGNVYAELIDEIYYGSRYMGDIATVDGFDEIITGATSDVMRYMFAGEGKALDVNQIMDWIEENEDDIEDELDIKLSNDVMKRIERDLEEFNDELEEDLEDMEVYGSASLKILRAVFGKTTAIIFAVLALICCAVVFLIFGKFYDKSMVYVGTTMGVHSLIGIVVATVIIILSKWIAENRGEEEFEFIFSFMAGRYISNTVIFLAVAIVLIVGGCLLRKKNKAYLA